MLTISRVAKCKQFKKYMNLFAFCIFITTTTIGGSYAEQPGGVVWQEGQVQGS